MIAKRGLDSICTSGPKSEKVVPKKRRQLAVSDVVKRFDELTAKSGLPYVPLDWDTHSEIYLDVEAERALKDKARNQFRQSDPKPAAMFKALAMRGYAVSRTEAIGTWVPYCDDPVKVVSRRRGSALEISLESSMSVPCRKCAKCLQFRQMRWRQRALNELSFAKRSWFITLTFSPVHLAGVLLRAKGSSEKEVEASAYVEVQKFFRRMRKDQPRAKFRYLAVYERGEETGRSHYHVLLHEVGTRPVLKAFLESHWRSHVHARLVSDQQRPAGVAAYVTKYLTKSLGIRPRASSGYGKMTKAVA